MVQWLQPAPWSTPHRRRSMSALARRCGLRPSGCARRARCGAAARITGDAPELGADVDADTALLELLRSRLELLGPVTANELARPMALDTTQIEATLLALEAQGA
jgi:hypothetical protein